MASPNVCPTLFSLIFVRRTTSGVEWKIVNGFLKENEGATIAGVQRNMTETPSASRVSVTAASWTS